MNRDLYPACHSLSPYCHIDRSSHSKNPLNYKKRILDGLRDHSFLSIDNELVAYFPGHSYLQRIGNYRIKNCICSGRGSIFWILDGHANHVALDLLGASRHSAGLTSCNSPRPGWQCHFDPTQRRSLSPLLKYLVIDIFYLINYSTVQFTGRFNTGLRTLF